VQIIQTGAAKRPGIRRQKPLDGARAGFYSPDVKNEPAQVRH
jgi:hypothetical protein